MHLLRHSLPIVLAAALLACSPAPSAQVLESLNSIESIMRQNRRDPDALILKLGHWANENQLAWEKIRNEYAQLSETGIERELSAYEKRIRQTMTNILDLDLEIQDRLRNDPERMSGYQQAFRRTGVLPM
ncbi:MAG: hypothetical protein FWC40_09080 [Proteobacteria bacterium]|nr:hypothetical protein [Pseudomonadota bacterium]